MKRKLTLMLALLFVWTGVAWSQGVTVKGVVTSEEDGLPIVGASVLVKGTTQGTITDVDGNFMISGVKADGKTLIVSFVGMKSKEVAIKNTPMHVVLKSDAEVLDEVVVTALGMKRSEKTLGYAATTMKSEDIDAGKSGSVMGGLSGKVAGVQISSAGNTGTSQKVLIRGISSLNNNSPLYIVDGVPIDNSTFRGSPTDDSSTTDFGNAANDINSEDVESVTILKGASATALYGSRAANGVVMITTKKAGVEKLTVTYDGSFTASKVLRVMQTQDLFGQGWGSWNRSENGSWGPRLDGTIHEWGSDQLETPMTKPFSYVEHNLRNFYQTGFEKNNNVSIRYGNDKVGVVASYGNLSSNGILPNNGDQFSRNTFSLRGYMNINKFSLDMTMNYVRKDISRSNDMYMELLQHAVDVDYSQMKDYNDERYNLDNYYTFYATNPYYMIDNYRSNYQDDRVYGRVEMSYEIMKGLKATGRLGGDFSNNRTNSQEPKTTFSNGSYSQLGGATESLGYYSEYRYNRSQIDATALLNADYKIRDFSINAVAGWNLNQRSYGYSGGYVDGLAVADWYSLYNTSSSAVSVTYKELRRLIGAFAQAELGYKDMMFLNLSGRNDWSSTLPAGNNSFFYGGANVSFLITEMLPSLKEHQVDFLKVRAALGQTGNDANVYKTTSWYQIANFKDINGYYTSMPIGGVMGMTSNNTLPSSSLKPEMTTEYEFGLSGSFFGNRLTVDASYYNRMTKDQIISASLAPETAYSYETKNIGKIQNQGVELMVNLTPVRTKDWTWDLGFTFTKNMSEVKELWEGTDEYSYTNWRGVYYVLKVGEPVGMFRIPAANKVMDESSPYYGYNIVNNNGYLSDSNTEYEYVGSSEAKFNMGFNTTLKWKGFTLSASADWRKGGYMLSNTSYISHFNGNSTQTVFNERNSFIYPHSVKVVNGQYVENNIPVRADEMYNALGNYSYSPEVRRHFIIPKDYFRLREVSLSYSFPKSMLAKTPFQQVSLALVGRNLLLFTPKENNYVDPEVSNLGNDLLSEFGETTGTSSTRNIGVNVKVVF